MDLLIVEPLEAEVLQWLDARHELFYAPHLPRDPQAFHEALIGARAVLLPPQVAVGARIIEQALRLRAIGRIVGGPEQIDLAACTRAHIEVVRCTEATAPAEAEFMLGALLGLLRPSPGDAGRVAGRELGACTVGLIGMGTTARAVAGLLRAFGSRLVGYDPAMHASDAQWSRMGVQPLSLHELFESADAVCVQLNYYTRYRGLLGERALTHCRPGQVLVSVSPLELFNEEVLADMLNSSRMAAAWLDSVGPAPLQPGQSLHGARGLLVTPRLAAYTREARVRSAWGVAQRIDEILRTLPDTHRSASRQRRAAPRPVPVAAPQAAAPTVPTPTDSTAGEFADLLFRAR
jgi:D-3-phosphoglycerate dehydrogenase